MNGLELARSMTTVGCTVALVDAAPAPASREVIAADEEVLARGDLDRNGDDSLMTRPTMPASDRSRSEVLR